MNSRNNNSNRLVVQQDDCNNFIYVFNKLRKSIVTNLHVGTLATYNSTLQKYDKNKGYGIITVNPFPLFENQESYILSCYYIEDREFSSNEIVTILYTDLSFINNLQSGKGIPRKGDESTMHSYMNGIVVSSSPLTITESKLSVNLTYNGKTYKLLKSQETEESE